MDKDSVKVEVYRGKYYELDKGDAMDMLQHCHAKAACLATLAPELHNNSYGRNDPTINGLAYLLRELEEDLEAVSEVLWTYRQQERGTKATADDFINPTQPAA